MKKPPVPSNEPARIQALRDYAVLDSPPEAAFDALTELAAQLVGVPIALISLVDAERQWFKSAHGLDVRETSRDVSFCGHAVASGVALVVPDTLEDPRFFDNPLVTGEPRIRFYAGMPIRNADGFILGTLCAIDDSPRALSPKQRRALELLAAQAVEQLELRRQGNILREQAATIASVTAAWREQAGHLQGVMDHANCGILEFDSEGTIRLFNAAAARMLGYETSEVVGKATPLLFLDPAEVAERATSLSSELEAPVEPGLSVLTVLPMRGVVEEREWRHVRKDGGELIAELAVTVRSDASGNLIGYLGVFNDVTQRKQTAETLRERERRLHLSADVGAALATAETLPQMLQGAAEALVEHLDATTARLWTLNETENVLELQANMGLFTHEDGPHTPIALGHSIIGRIAESRAPYMTNAVGGDPLLRHEPWASTNRITSFAGYPLLVAERLVGVMAMFAAHPLSENTVAALGFAAQTIAVGIARKRADGELVQFKATLESCDDAILMFDPGTLRISYANQGAVAQLGYSADQLLQKTLPDIAPNAAEPQQRALLAALASGERASARIESVRKHKDGRPVPVEVLLQYEKSSGDCPRFVSIARDISERKRLDRLKSEFVSTVSHELRTPLTSIRGALGLVAAGVLGALPPAAKEYITIALSNSERLIRLVNDILDIEKLQSDAMEFELRTLDLKAVVQRGLQANAGFAAHHNVSVRLADDPARGDVLADEGRLAQVITNLLSNAIKFSPKEGEVEVSIRRNGDRLRVSIRDHGPGIPEAFLSRIFQRFSQADASTTRKHGGSGLGLNIAKAIVERLRGKIGFEAADGGGTIFFFELPFVMPLDGYAETRQNLALVCEDDAEAAAAISSALSAAGFAPHVAPTAERARRLLGQHRYRLMTLDLVLADGDSSSLISEVRASTVHRDLPVIVISAEAGNLSPSCFAAVDVIQKPFDPARLKSALESATPKAREGSISILHVEDDDDVCRIIARQLPASWKVTTASSLATARERLRAEAFDIVLLDLSLPDGDGAALLTQVGGARVVIFSGLEASSRLSAQVAMVFTKTRAAESEVCTRLVGLAAELTGTTA